MTNDLLQLGRILQPDSNGPTAGEMCSSPAGDDQVRLRSLYRVHYCVLCMHAAGSGVPGLEQASKLVQTKADRVIVRN